MLESLHVRNFQKHRKFHLRFSGGVTCIVGASDQGKSSLLRALRWVCCNQPDGDSFMSWGETSCSVTLKVDGHRISRKRGKRQNTYHLDGKTYRAFGRGEAPSEIVQLLNISEDSFQRQIAPPHLFTLTPGQVAKELNRVVALDAIDAALTVAAQEVRKAKSNVELTDERLNAARAEEERLIWVPEMLAELGSLESLEAEEAKVALNARQGRDLLRVGGESLLRRERAQNAVLDALAGIRAGERALQAREKVRQAQALLENLRETEERCRSASSQLREAERKEVELMRERCPACQRPMPTQ